MKVFSVLTPEDKEKVGFLIDTIHRVGVPRDIANRPIIVQFNMRSNKVILRGKKVQLKKGFDTC